MTRRSNSPPPAPPSISKREGRRRLTVLLERGEALLAQRPLNEGQEEVWSTACIEVIMATFGEHTNHASTFIGQIHMVISNGVDSYDRHAEMRDAESVQRRVGILRTLVEQIDLEIGFDAPAPPPAFWDDIHPLITRVSKPRYDAGHFADCVEAGLKEINAIVKEHVKQRTTQEMDGAALMLKAFSPNGPLIVLDDLSTESGRNVQQGYMHLYAGSMIGIRNPKAHANVTINDVRARHFLYLASLLAYRFDERL